MRSRPTPGRVYASIGSPRTAPSPLRNPGPCRRLLPRPAPDTPTTEPELLTLLRWLHTSSGVGKTALAKKTGITRSQVHRILQQDRGTMPTKPEQVQALLRAFGLPEAHVTEYMTLWNTIKTDQHPTPTAAPIDTEPVIPRSDQATRNIKNNPREPRQPQGKKIPPGFRWLSAYSSLLSGSSG
ncbi:helix-turn-helix domain-containing protein [Actinokineospora sp. 24-640]